MSQAWIRFSGQDNSAAKMFCFPYAGGSAQVFRPVTSMIPKGIDVFGLEMPGHGRRFSEAMDKDLDTTIDRICHEIVPLLDGPYLFFGHSLGGIIAFELIRKLRDKGMALPMHLFVSGIRAPQIPKRETLMYNLPYEDFVERLKEVGGTPDEVLENQELLEMMVPILRKDFELYETYHYRKDPPLDCPITAFSGSQDKYVKSEDVQKWSEHTNILFTKHMLEGGHFFIHKHFREVLDIVSRTISITLKLI